MTRSDECDEADELDDEDRECFVEDTVGLRTLLSKDDMPCCGLCCFSK